MGFSVMVWKGISTCILLILSNEFEYFLIFRNHCDWFPWLLVSTRYSFVLYDHGDWLCQSCGPEKFKDLRFLVFFVKHIHLVFSYSACCWCIELGYLNLVQICVVNFQNTVITSLVTFYWLLCWCIEYIVISYFCMWERFIEILQFLRHCHSYVGGGNFEC